METTKIKLTSRLVATGVGCGPATAALWLSSLQAACDKFDINTPERIAAFLANVGVESNGLSDLEEELNYTAKGLANTWPGRYAANPLSRIKVPNQDAYELANVPERIANNVYANRLGNGAPGTGDGWTYRGRGPIQITGKSNFESFFKAAGVPTETRPDSLVSPSLGSMSAAWFFSSKGCNELADNGHFNAIVARINGEPPCPANDGGLRLDRFNAVLSALKK